MDPLDPDPVVESSSEVKTTLPTFLVFIFPHPPGTGETPWEPTLPLYFIITILELVVLSIGLKHFLTSFPRFEYPHPIEYPRKRVTVGLNTGSDTGREVGCILGREWKLNNVV